MTTRPLIPVVAAAAGAALAIAAPGSAQGPASTSFALLQQDDRSHLVDAPPRHGERRPSEGDAYLISNVLLDPATHARVGRTHGVCQVTVPGRHGVALCTQTLVTRGGTLAIEGAYPLAKQTLTFAVTGGTGSYDGATGSVVFHGDSG